ncbi:MAG: hypothetical protein KGH67_05405, partial [Candidatus Micrarchaeota archaeon]|nr:hypothetical protein [Candidatus Micrarchaeota archaeon]
SSAFFGAVGPNDSAGKNGTFNNYGFYAAGSTWYFTMNGKVLGSVDMGTNTSGYNDAVAFGEVANTSNAKTTLPPIMFYNLSIYRQGAWLPAPTGFSYIGYGVGSLNNLANPYGVQEIGARADAFEVGTGLPRPQNNFPLWETSYSLNIQSRYGNLSNSAPYIGYKSVQISAPILIYVSNNTREMFAGWKGVGAGSYSGMSNYTSVTMFSNITEIAQWKTQYLVNITSSMGLASGSGWYAPNSTVHYSVNPNTIYENDTARSVFLAWKNGSSTINGTFNVTRPININAVWVNEYLLNATTPYGNVIGTGWYASNSTANLSATLPYLNETATRRLAFFGWSDGNKSQSRKILLSHPYELNAIYRNQSLVGLYGINQNGTQVAVQYFSLNNQVQPSKTYLFDGSTYTVTSAMYKGTNLSLTQQVSALYPGNVFITLPLYNVNIFATDVFGVPLSIPVNVTFSNGTTRTVQLINGKATLSNVPYGKATLSAQYLGFSLSSTAQYGVQARLTTISALDFTIIAAIILLAIIAYLFVSIKFLHHAHDTSKYGVNQ